MSSSTWRVLSGYATYQRTPIRMTSLGKWAPLKLIAIVALPHDVPLLTAGDHTVNRLKEKLRQNQKKTHTDKNLLLVNETTSKVVYLGPTTAGRTHDKKAADDVV